AARQARGAVQASAQGQAGDLPRDPGRLRLHGSRARSPARGARHASPSVDGSAVSAGTSSRSRGGTAGVPVAGVIYFVTGILTAEMAKGAPSHAAVVAWR